MSNKNRLKLQKVKIFWEKYEEKVVLGVGILLIAAISFEVGILQGHKLEQKTLVIEKAPEIAWNDATSPNKVLGAETSASGAPAKTLVEGEGSTNKECAFVGSKNSDKYHRPDCRWAKNIKPENLVCFKSEEEAKSRGYVGDKTCVK